MHVVQLLQTFTSKSKAQQRKLRLNLKNRYLSRYNRQNSRLFRLNLKELDVSIFSNRAERPKMPQLPPKSLKILNQHQVKAQLKSLMRGLHRSVQRLETSTSIVRCHSSGVDNLRNYIVHCQNLSRAKNTRLEAFCEL